MIVLIPLLPLAAFLTLVLSGRRIGEQENHRVTVPALAGAFILSIVVCAWVLTHGPVRVDLYPWITSGAFTVRLGLYVDQLVVFMLLLVTGVTTLVHLFSARYMQGDPRVRRFFALISLFPFAMLMLVMSSNLLQLYFFWEVMGICSFLLISHAAERPAACRAALRVFLINAVADVGLGLGVLLTFLTFGTLEIQELLAAAPAKAAETINLLSAVGLTWQVDVLTVIVLLFFFGAMGKSAQFPLHVWLPFAMEAPTPVSALIHAATMVKAGIFLLLRLSPLLLLAPAAMMVITIIGAVTALGAAAIALTQNDIKRILAYSTISQLGFMTLACGVGAFVAALFHLLAHGVLKAFLFLSSGSALQQLAHHAPPLHDEQSRTVAPRWAVGGLVFAVLPPLLLAMSGYSGLWGSGRVDALSPLFWLLLAAVCLLTSGYLLRGLVHGGPRSGLLPAFVTVATISGLLAALLAVTWKHFVVAVSPVLAPTTVSPGPSILIVLMLGVGAALGGWLVAAVISRYPVSRSPLAAGWSHRLYVLVHNKGYLDEFYDAAIVRPTLRVSRWLWQAIDLGVIERLTVGVAVQSVRFSHWLWQAIDGGVIERLTVGVAAQSMRFSHWLWQVVDIRLIDWLVEGLTRLTVGVARWLWQAADVRGLERFVGRVGRQNEVTGELLQRIEPSMLQHQLLVMIFTLVAAMVLFLIFFL